MYLLELRSLLCEVFHCLLQHGHVKSRVSITVWNIHVYPKTHKSLDDPSMALVDSKMECCLALVSLGIYITLLLWGERLAVMATLKIGQLSY